MVQTALLPETVAPAAEMILVGAGATSVTVTFCKMVSPVLETVILYLAVLLMNICLSPVFTTFRPAWTTTVQASSLTVPALLEVASATLQTLPRLVVLNVTGRLLDWPGPRSPTLKLRALWPLS